MLADAAASVAQYFSREDPWVTVQKILLLIFLSLCSLLLSWRFWSFTVRPFLRPHEPKPLPYWIPYFGHAGSFFKDSHKLMAGAVKHFGRTREPFSIMVAGTKYYVLTDPQDASDFYANVTTLSWDGFLNETLHAFGVSRDRLDVLWERPSRSTAVNPSAKCLIHLTQELYQKHLIPGPTFSTLMNTFDVALNSLLNWDAISTRYPAATTPGERTLSLFSLCADIMIDATQMTLFDNILFSIDPSMSKKMPVFTDDLWKLMYPSRLIDSKEVTAIRDQYTKAFLIYQRLPKELRKGEAWVVTTLIDQYRELGIHEDDSAAMLVMIYWTGDANAYKLAFWMMSYILYDQQLYEAIREETLPAMQGKLDTAFLASKCTLLKAVYHEALRLTKRDLGYRKVDRDTHIGNKVLRGGNFGMVPVCQLHDNAQVFGLDARTFNPQRFLADKGLTSSPSYKPYGGGKTYCPGRFFAMQEIFGFVALLIHRFNIRLAYPGQNFPLPDESMLTLGVSRPAPGQTVAVTLSCSKA